MKSEQEQARANGSGAKGRGIYAERYIGEPLLPMPEVVVLLDSEQRIVRFQDKNPGLRLGRLSLRLGTTFHELLHPGCEDPDCVFLAGWRRGWDSHASGLPVEWMVASHALEGVFKLRLQSVSYACAALFGGAVSCYSDHSVLFVKDITSGYADAEHDEHPDWKLYDGPAEQPRIMRRLMPAASPVLEPAADKALSTALSGLLVAQDAEQKRLAAELHDGLGQSLSILRFEIESCLEHAGSAADVASTLARASQYVRHAQEELRQITCHLGPLVLCKHGLIGALNLLCKDFQLARPDVRLHEDLRTNDAAVPGRIATAVYRIAQEALNNVATHARAANVTLKVVTGADSLTVLIEDDGVGLPVGDERRLGLGLSSMRDRTEGLGGSFELISAPGEGCTIRSSWDSRALRLAGD